MNLKGLNLEQLTEVRKGQVGTGLLVEHDGHIKRDCDTIRQIHEDINNNQQFVIPEHFIVPAVFQKYGIKNANGRIYPEKILKREVEKYKERIANRCALGSLDQPASSSISGHDISHNILSLDWQGHTLVGELELHLSPGYIRYGVCSTSGDLVANMLLSNYLIGVSSRGVGSVEQKYGELVVCDDFEIICWDVVIDPSTPGAFIGNDKSELQQYVENIIPTNDVGIVNEDKISMIEQILNS